MDFRTSNTSKGLGNENTQEGRRHYAKRTDKIGRDKDEAPMKSDRETALSMRYISTSGFSLPGMQMRISPADIMQVAKARKRNAGKIGKC